MSYQRFASTIACVSAGLALLSACSPPTHAPPDAAPAAEASAAPAPAPVASPATAAAPAPAAAPAAGAVKLDIKDASGTQLSGDPASGKQVFNECMVCHAIEAGVNKVGPSLHGIIGRHSGQIAGYNYSDANKGSGLVWTEQELYVYLENPQKTVPGTYMTYTGVKDPQKRADVIAYLQENTK